MLKLRMQKAGFGWAFIGRGIETKASRKVELSETTYSETRSNSIRSPAHYAAAKCK